MIHFGGCGGAGGGGGVLWVRGTWESEWPVTRYVTPGRGVTNFLISQIHRTLPTGGQREGNMEAETAAYPFPEVHGGELRTWTGGETMNGTGRSVRCRLVLCELDAALKDQGEG